MWELDHKEGWVPKNWCFWTVCLEEAWTTRRSNQSMLKEIIPEYSLEGLKLKLQYLVTWCKEKIIRKDPDAGKDWRQEEKGPTEDETVLRGDGVTDSMDIEFEQAQGDGKGQEILACCVPWSRRVRHDWVTEQQWQNLPQSVFLRIKRANKGKVLKTLPGTIEMLATIFHSMWNIFTYIQQVLLNLILLLYFTSQRELIGDVSKRNSLHRKFLQRLSYMHFSYLFKIWWQVFNINIVSQTEDGSYTMPKRCWMTRNITSNQYF